MFLDEMTRYLREWNPVEVEEISPLLVTYRPMRSAELSPLHLEMLKPVPDPSKLFPEAPNRQGVEQNLLNSIRSFEEAFRSIGEADTGHRQASSQGFADWRFVNNPYYTGPRLDGSQDSAHEQDLLNSIKSFEEALPSFGEADPGHRLATWRDLLRLNIQHASKAERHFSNGQSIVTVVSLDNGLFSLAFHDEEGLRDFLRPDPMATFLSIRAPGLTTVKTTEEVQAAACRWLADAKESQVAVLVEGKLQTMTWRPWGCITIDSGYPKMGVVLKVGDRSAWVDVVLWEIAELNPYAVLNRLSEFLPGVEAATCATCRNFLTSGMTNQFYGGAVGVCGLAAEQWKEGQPHPNVEVTHRCDQYTMVPYAERRLNLHAGPYLA